MVGLGIIHTYLFNFFFFAWIVCVLIMMFTSHLIVLAEWIHWLYLSDLPIVFCFLFPYAIDFGILCLTLLPGKLISVGVIHERSSLKSNRFIFIFCCNLRNHWNFFPTLVGGSWFVCSHKIWCPTKITYSLSLILCIEQF